MNMLTLHWVQLLAGNVGAFVLGGIIERRRLRHATDTAWRQAEHAWETNRKLRYTMLGVADGHLEFSRLREDAEKGEARP